jgi:uncharacterized membrane protein
MKTDELLQRLVKEGTVDPTTAAQILEAQSKYSIFSFGNMLIGVAGFAIVLGVVALIGVNWEHISNGGKIAIHAMLNATIAGILFSYARSDREKTIWFDLLVGLFASFTLTFLILIEFMYPDLCPYWVIPALWMLLTTPFWLYLADRRQLVSMWASSFVISYIVFVCLSFPSA